MSQRVKYNHYNIDPLNGNNYEAWKFRVEAILIEYNVDDMRIMQTRKEEKKRRKGTISASQ